MARAMHTGPTGVVSPLDSTTLQVQPAVQAYQILHFAFTIAPLVAGLDKFTHFLVNWDRYVAPLVTQLVGGYTHQFMMVVGAIEIIAAIGVAFKPRVFSYIVAVWLLMIVFNLLLCGTYFDIALRDFGLSLGAFALARLSETYAH